MDHEVSPLLGNGYFPLGNGETRDLRDEAGGVPALPSFDEVAVFNAANGDAGDADGRAGRVVDAVEAPVHTGEIGFGEGDNGVNGDLRELRAHDVVEVQEFGGAVAIAVA